MKSLLWIALTVFTGSSAIADINEDLQRLRQDNGEFSTVVETKVDPDRNIVCYVSYVKLIKGPVVGLSPAPSISCVKL